MIVRTNDTALVLFSGGQDSTVCLAWALQRFGHVETIGFDYGQRHRAELDVRPRIRERMAALRPDWAARLSEDHVIKIDALAAISETALTRDVAIEIADTGLPTTFVPGRNLVFFAFAGALAYRRGARHLVAGMCETDYSGYPDCRDDTIKAMQLALDAGHGPATHDSYPADVDRQGGDLFTRAGNRREMRLWNFWWRRRIPVISATARGAMFGDTAAASVPPAGCEQTDLRSGSHMLTKDTLEARRRREGIIFLVLFALTIPLANWLIGNVGTKCVPNGPCLIPVAPGLLAPSGVTMIGIALVLRDLVQRRLGVGVAVGAILAGAALSALIAPPALVVASGVAFLLSELADFAVYTPLARRRMMAAVVASSLVGLVVDFDRVPLARLRLARIFGRAGGRQGLDGARLGSIGAVAQAPRRAHRRGAGVVIRPGLT